MLQMTVLHYFLKLSNFHVSIDHIFFIRLSDGHLGCFPVLAVVNSSAMNIEVHVSFGIDFFLFFWIYTQEWNYWIMW